MIFIIEDDKNMANCIALAINSQTSDLSTSSPKLSKTPQISNAPVPSKKPSRPSLPLIKIFPDAISAMDAISRGQLPNLIFLDILLDGPDGFTFLNELASYDDTAKIPVVIVSSLTLAPPSAYGVVGILNKDTFTPEDIKNYVQQFLS